MSAFRCIPFLLLAFVGSVAQAHEERAHAEHAQDSSVGHAAALGVPGKADAVSRTVAVSMSDAMRFTPDRISVKAGETIRFRVRNTGKLKHEMVLGTRKELADHAALMRRFPDMQHEDPNAISLEPGASGEILWRFTRGGSFSFACLVPGHMEAGMVGALEVAARR